VRLRFCLLNRFTLYTNTVIELLIPRMIKRKPVRPYTLIHIIISKFGWAWKYCIPKNNVLSSFSLTTRPQLGGISHFQPYEHIKLMATYTISHMFFPSSHQLSHSVRNYIVPRSHKVSIYWILVISPWYPKFEWILYHTKITFFVAAICLVRLGAPATFPGSPCIHSISKEPGEQSVIRLGLRYLPFKDFELYIMGSTCII